MSPNTHESIVPRALRPASRALAVTLAAGVSALFLAGCATAPGAGADGRPAVCRDDALGWAVGQSATEETMRRLLAESGAGLINAIGPATIVRKDQRADRLRVYIDASNTITAARCE